MIRTVSLSPKTIPGLKAWTRGRTHNDMHPNKNAQMHLVSETTDKAGARPQAGRGERQPNHTTS
eukprot:295625-Pyramimonas_sp.AAC.1